MRTGTCIMESLRLILFGLLLLGNDAFKLNLNTSTSSSSSSSSSILTPVSVGGGVSESSIETNSLSVSPSTLLSVTSTTNHQPKSTISSPSSSTFGIQQHQQAAAAHQHNLITINNISNKNNNSTLKLQSPSTISLSSVSASIKRNTRADTFTGPYLDGQEITNVTQQIGVHSYLPCKVKQAGNKSVSWIRVRDAHILTVDRTTFIADERFQAIFVETDGIWTLQIKYVQARDEGTYECQVSTEPKTSARVHLKVIVPKTEIVGDAERFVKAGSTVVLRCVVRGALESPSYIIWYHSNNQIYVNDESRNGWQSQIDRELPGIDGDTHSTIGSLVITTVKKKDAGNYTCSPSNSDSVTVSLNVLNGDYLASAITSSASQEEYRNLIVFLLLILATLQT